MGIEEDKNYLEIQQAKSDLADAMTRIKIYASKIYGDNESDITEATEALFDLGYEVIEK